MAGTERLTRDFFLGFIKVHILHHASEESIYGLAMIEELSTSWREGFRRKSVAGYVEDTAPRLAGT